MDKANQSKVMSMHQVWTLLVGITSCMPAVVLAATSQPYGNNVAGSGLVIALAIVYLSRRRAIGGWLLYFYVQLYFSLLFSLFFLPTVFANLNPAAWDSSKLYVLSFLGTVPVLLAGVFEIFTATMLLFRRNGDNLKLLRIALAALAVTSSVSLGIDIGYFSESPTMFFDVLTFVFACIWCGYFWRAKRVRLVFIDKAWDYAAVSPPRVLTTAEKRYLRKRAAIVGSATFIVLLLIIGFGWGDKKPELEIFLLPFFYALFAAVIAWYVPLRRKKREALVKSQATVT